MKQVHPLTTAATGFLAAGIATYFSGYPIIASAACLVAIQMCGPEIPKFSSWYQIIVITLASVFLGITLDYADNSLSGFLLPFGITNLGPTHYYIPFQTITMLLVNFALLFRLVFYKNALHSRFLWVEPTALLLGIAAMVTGNLVYHARWSDWFFPVIPILFTLNLVIGFVREGRFLNKLASKEQGTKVGSTAPDFELPDQNGNSVRLSDLKGKRNVLLIFLRGDWCPACHMMLRAYAKSSDRLRDKNVLLLAIGPDELGTNKEMAEKLGIEYRVLADPKQEVARAYGTHLEHDPIPNPMRPRYEAGLPMPSSFLLCDQLIIRYNSRADRVGEFLHPEEIFSVLDGIKKSVLN
jgi:peroxiredoxin